MDYGDIHDLAHPMSISAHNCLRLTEIYLSGDLASAQRASPFLMSWAFHVFMYFYDRYQLDGHRESLQSLNVMRKGVEALGDKWKLAGTWYSSCYLRSDLTEETEVFAVLMNGNQVSSANSDRAVESNEDQG